MALQFSKWMIDGMTAGSLVNTPHTINIFAEIPPENCAASDPATLLGTLSGSDTVDLSLNWDSEFTLNNATTWSIPITAAGTAQSFRLYSSTDLCLAQGSITETGDGGDMIVSSATFAEGDTLAVTSYSLVFGNQ